jgi:hypothetical protein
VSLHDTIFLIIHHNSHYIFLLVHGDILDTKYRHVLNRLFGCSEPIATYMTSRRILFCALVYCRCGLVVALADIQMTTWLWPMNIYACMVNHRCTTSCTLSVHSMTSNKQQTSAGRTKLNHNSYIDPSFFLRLLFQES